MGRAFSRGCKLLGTTNGGLPTQEFYTEFVNHAVVQYRDNVPSVELSEMLEDKPYYHYYHFNIKDDAPHLTDEDRERLFSLYPENSFYYTSKILGVRGAVEGDGPVLACEQYVVHERDDGDAGARFFGAFYHA